jgi:hypothetical protein
MILFRGEDSPRSFGGFTMRVLLTASIPTERGNAAIREGTLETVIRHALEILKPEAAYFAADDLGNRCAYLVIDIQDASEIPAVAEPFFLGLGAKVTMRPCMNAQDLANAKPGMERAVREFSAVHA